MRRPLALAAAALTGLCGAIVLTPPALSSRPTAVASIAPQDAQLQLLAARANLKSESVAARAAAARFALRSIRAMPYNQPALTLAIAGGAVERRTDAANLSAALGWRDTLTNARIARLAIAEQAPDIAAQRVDALGRTQGGEFAAPAVDTVMAMSGGSEALARRARYRTAGLWWISYLRLPARNAEAQEGRLAFASNLDTGEGPWRRLIIGTLIGSMKGENAAAEQLALWRTTLADPARFGAVLYDEDFTTFDPAAPAYGGEWRRPKTAPVAVERTANGLLLTSTSSQAGMVMAQRFPAQPGRLRLSAEGRMPSGRLSWELVCLGRSAVFATGAAEGDWGITVPADCPVAELRLNARAVTKASGVDMLERVSLKPVS